MKINKDVFNNVCCVFCLIFGIGGAIRCFIDGEVGIAFILLFVAVIGFFVFPFTFKKK
ncbi:MAG: hypothetical protein IKA85_06925 [Clostridia bacterium]|nr:hypothetical protein [Clostridia bacterium]